MLIPHSLGRKVARFKTRDSKRHFTVHEDLLCASSKFFKARLHRNRKAIVGECSICTNGFDSKLDDITFCAACGQNIHDECIEK